MPQIIHLSTQLQTVLGIVDEEGEVRQVVCNARIQKLVPGSFQEAYNLIDKERQRLVDGGEIPQPSEGQ